jgi:hypothetical protein
VAYEYTWGYRCKKLTAGIIFPHFPLETGFLIVAAIVFPLLADSGNWHTATNSSELQRETYSRYWFNSGKPISAISWLASR